MISKEELDSLRQYLKCKGVTDLHNLDWYSVNGLEIRIDTECGPGVIFVYLTRDKWLIACTTSASRSNDNPHNVIVLDYAGLIRLIDGGEMAYNNMENEWILDEL